MEPSLHAALAQLPSVDALLERWAERDPTPLALRRAWARAALEEARAEIRGDPSRSRERAAWFDLLGERLRSRRIESERGGLKRVINATGVLLHTNLGRAPLGLEAQQAVHEAIAGYSTLEFDLVTGTRRSRLASVRDLLILVTGAEDALAVHNNAASVYLALTALAAGREVVVSRGHLVEIGGGFRLPDIMAASGARLVEVGTTNRTRLEDYGRAIGPETALVLEVHPSNFRLVGFTEGVATTELARLARARGVPLFVDLGSGALRQHGPLALGEPRVQDALEAGADLVAVSGDKLLGGPQAGILVGAKQVVQALASHPFARVVRLEKASLAALEATLRAYLDPASLVARVPLLALLALAPDELRARAEAMARALVDAGVRAEVQQTEAEVGGGSLPGVELPSWAVAIDAPSADALITSLRGGDPPVVARIERDRVLLDVRTLLPGEEAELVPAVRTALEGRR